METPSSSTRHKEDNHACLHTPARERMMEKMAALADLPLGRVVSGECSDFLEKCDWAINKCQPG